jgi:hypothetical protein
MQSKKKLSVVESSLTTKAQYLSLWEKNICKKQNNSAPCGALFAYGHNYLTSENYCNIMFLSIGQLERLKWD